MSAFATITRTGNRLEFRCPAASGSEDRPLINEDLPRWQGWAPGFLQATRQNNNPVQLPALGEEIHGWLNGGSSFLNRILDFFSSLVLIEFGPSKQDERDPAKAFLNAPWELLASEG